MTSRSALPWLILVLAGCSSDLGRVKITVVFENETRTQCIKASAKTTNGAVNNSTPAALPRGGKNSITIGLGETSELVGEVKVTVSRFSSSDCTGSAFASETKAIEVVHAGPVAMLEFRYSDPAGDGGTDGGVDAGADAGLDAGCETSSCGNAPGECEVAPATGCGTDGGCRFGFKAPQTTCSLGLCNSMGACISNICAVAAAGTACDDGLMCTSNSTCQGGACQGGVCAAPPQCNQNFAPIACNPTTMTACVLKASDDFTGCGPNGSGRQCLDGGCVPWLQFAPTNFPSTLATTPYPSGAWNLASPDGGTCNTIIDTTTTPPNLQASECGAPPITATVNDAGVAVLTMTGLTVGPAVRLQFVGSRPVQLLVLGDASIRGIVSVAPLQGGQQPAGTGAPGCNAAGTGMTGKKAGGGGGFGGVGGNGGEGGGMGGAISSSMSIPLRDGCPGGAGFRASGNSPGGTGGGAIQLIVAETLTMLGGVVTASGGGGTEGTLDGEGAGGGGSGGMVIIEARNVDLTGGAVTANGGGGGEGGETGRPGLPGDLGPIQSITGAASANGSSAGGAGGTGGDNGTANGGLGGNGGGASGGGGGGGAAGVVYVKGHTSCIKGSGLISGAQPATLPTCL